MTGNDKAEMTHRKNVFVMTTRKRSEEHGSTQVRAEDFRLLLRIMNTNFCSGGFVKFYGTEKTEVVAEGVFALKMTAVRESSVRRGIETDKKVGSSSLA